MKNHHLILTREQHLDHMVKVVPLLVLCYGLQCYAILNMKNAGMAGTFLAISGVCLALMIGAFICYDLKHQVTFFEDHLRIQFFSLVKVIPYSAVDSVEVSEPSGTFSKIIINHHSGRTRFYFVDDAAAIKKWIDARNVEQSKAA